MIQRISSTIDKVSRKQLFSILSMVGIMSSLIFFSFHHQYWKKNKVVDHDVVSYYGYLPSILIYHDLTLDFLYNGQLTNGEGNVRIWFEETKEGKRYFKMPIGVSVMTSPFFMLAHVISKSTGSVSNGYTEIYFFAIVFAAWFYAFLTLFYLRKILQEFEVSDLAISLTLISLFLATNLLFYTAVESGMSHLYGLCALTYCFYGTIRWHKLPKLRYALMVGFGLGLATIVRPTNLIFFLVPMIYGIHSMESLRTKIALIWKHLFHFVFCFFIFGGVVFIQLLAWKIGTGDWIIYSYNEEKLHLGDPHILKGLFGYRKGLFVYSPILFISLMGFFLIPKKKRWIHCTIIPYLFAFSYVIFSWWCWWYGGSLGMRAMIESFVILSLPMAFFFDRVAKRWAFIPIGLVVIFFVYLNFFLTNSYVNGILHMDSMTKASYWELVTSKNVSASYFEKMKKPCYYNALRGNSDEELYREVMRSISKKNMTSTELQLFTIPASQFFYKSYPMDLIHEGSLRSPEFIPGDGSLRIVTRIRNTEDNSLFFVQSDTLVCGPHESRRPINIRVSLPITHLKSMLIESFLFNSNGVPITLHEYALIKEAE